ncbi:MAG: DUF2235 domain-containing protein [Pseudomonadota bacterium]
MSERSIDGVDVKVATPEQLAGYTAAQDKVDRFDVPRIYNSLDPKARVFVALFDGTGNDVINDPQHATNVGILKSQVERMAQENPNIQGVYLEGPGTQRGLKGVVDGAIGYTYQDRIDQMYSRFNERATEWLAEDPQTKISVVSVGFSRGAEQAAGFSRVIEERGVQGSQRVQMPTVASEQAGAIAPQAALKAPGEMPQALALYDPVGTGAPHQNDRRPPPSVVSGFQITAADEQRALFPSTAIIAQGKSEDGRFLGVTTAGAHSDIGGSYQLNGLSSRNYNLMAGYLNKVLGEDAVKKLEVPAAPEKSVIHDSTQHAFYYRGVKERNAIEQLEPSGKLAIEPVNPAIMEQVKAQQRDPRAESFAKEAPEIALKKYPELAGAYAAIAAIDRQAEKDGMSAQQRELVSAHVHRQTVKSIERGEIPEVSIRAPADARQERSGQNGQSR